MTSTRLAVLSSVCCALTFAFAAQAAPVNGTVTNRTSGKPAAGDAVVLVEPMSGMAEIARTTTDARGHYSLNLPGTNPYLIKAIHQNAEYFIAAPQGGGNGDIPVYDVAAKIDGVTIDEHVIGVESVNGNLRVAERFLLHNTSSPPRTQWSPRSFEVILPPEAAVGDASAQRPGAASLPTSVKLEGTGTKGHYAFNFPIQPDDAGKGTLFQLEYEVPYSSEKYTFHSQVSMLANTVWVVLPKSMTFASESGSAFSPSQQDPGVQTFLARNTQPGNTLAFTISGAGSFPREDQNQQQDSSVPTNQPGGGIGEPINTPDPLSKYKWWILGGLGVLLFAAAAFLLRKPADAAVAGAPGAHVAVPSQPLHVPSSSPGAKNSALLNALKEELFSLESEKLSGTIGAAEYAEQKAALETVLKRALKRSS